MSKCSNKFLKYDTITTDIEENQVTFQTERLDLAIREKKGKKKQIKRFQKIWKEKWKRNRKIKRSNKRARKQIKKVRNKDKRK